MYEAHSPGVVERVIGDKLGHGRAPPVITKVQRDIRCRRLSLLALPQAAAEQQASVGAAECDYAGAVETRVCSLVGSEQIAANALLLQKLCRIRRTHGDHAADGRTAIQRRCRTSQYFSPLNQACIDEIPGGVREPANIELIAERNAIDQYGDAVAADAPDIDALAAETCACRFVVNARRISQHIGKRYRQAVFYLRPGKNSDIGRDVTNGACILVRHDDNFVDRIRFPVILLRVGHRQAQEYGKNRHPAIERSKFIAYMWHRNVASPSMIHSVGTLPKLAAQTIGRYTYTGDAGTYR